MSGLPARIACRERLSEPPTKATHQGHQQFFLKRFSTRFVYITKTAIAIGKEPRQADTMGMFDSDSTNIDLTCDFPARESFRMTLLERLLAMNEQGLQAESSEVTWDHSEHDSGIRVLSDSELEMLAAAQGDLYSLKIDHFGTGQLSPGLFDES